MRTSDFDYHLPAELIAQTPVEPRDASRLLVLDRASGNIEHRRFTGLLDYLRPGDVMVFNQSRVIHARIRGRRADTGGKVEFLLLREQETGVWQALAQPGRRLRPGARVILDGPPEPPGESLRFPQAPLYKGGIKGGFYAEVLESHTDGTKSVRLPPDAGPDRLGRVPLPPYIHQRLEDPERYQTVYAKRPGQRRGPHRGITFYPGAVGPNSKQGCGVGLRYPARGVGHLPAGPGEGTPRHITSIPSISNWGWRRRTF